MKKKNRVKTTLSKSQWKKIDAAFGVSTYDPLKHKSLLRTHINSELNKLATLCKEVASIEECRDCQEERIYGLPLVSWESLAIISAKTGIKDPSTIVTRFIINPLLLKD